MYEAFADPYCYPGTTTLKNKLDLRDFDRLAAFEAEISEERAAEPLPPGRLSIRHYRAVHRHMFQDVYAWAGRFRTIRIGKGTSMFCYPENIGSEMRRCFAWLKQSAWLRGIEPEAFAQGAARFLTDLNAIHPFREGNGRTQMTFMTLLAEKADHPLALDRLDPEIFLSAMIHGFLGDERPLTAQFRRLIERDR
jgi:cell filamentation protein